MREGMNKANAVGEECAEPTVLISRCHGLASCHRRAAITLLHIGVVKPRCPSLSLLPLLVLPPLLLLLLPSHSFGHRLFAPAL